MRRVALCVAAVALAALPARAVDRILYATANSQDEAGGNRVDGFCLRGDGGLAPTPTVRIQTGDTLPRRLLVGKSAAGGQVLYVAERGRVEAYEIVARGGLKLLGRTRLFSALQLAARDLSLAADGRTLYVPQPLRNRILAYPIADNGAPKDLADDDPSLTCVQGSALSRYDSVIAHGTRLYVSAPGTNRVEVYALEADGRIGGTVTNADDTTGPPLSGAACLEPVRNETPVSDVLSKRTRLLGARSMLLNGNVLYVEERVAKRVVSFALTADGLFDPALPPGNKEKDKLQQRRGRTARGVGYFGLLIVPPAETSPPAPATLFGTQFFHGRIDAFALPAGGLLPMQGMGPRMRPLETRFRTKDDLKTSPVRMDADKDVLYVAAGALDRVQAYRLRMRKADGTLKSMALFSQTDEQAGSFPNDVAVAVLSGDCR